MLNGCGRGLARVESGNNPAWLRALCRVLGFATLGVLGRASGFWVWVILGFQCLRFRATRFRAVGPRKPQTAPPCAQACLLRLGVIQYRPRSSVLRRLGAT